MARTTFYDKDNRFTVLDRVHKYRAIKYGVDWEAKAVQTVMATANKRCGVCKVLIDMEARQPDPFSLNIDHIVPLSQGGTHTAENIQITHRICNSKKWNTERKDKTNE